MPERQQHPPGGRQIISTPTIPSSPYGPFLPNWLYTLEEVARHCIRHPETLRHLVHDHKLPFEYGYVPTGFGAAHRRIMLIPATTAHRLLKLTLLRKRR